MKKFMAAGMTGILLFCFIAVPRAFSEPGQSHRAYDEPGLMRIIQWEGAPNTPIETSRWALLVETVLGLPAESKGQLLDMYVYGLAGGDLINREDAVGGLVKLLTIKPYIKGSVSAVELERSLTLADLQDIGERQRTLVQMAFCEGILDSTVTTLFRPKEQLTVAEAVSMMSRVAARYNIDVQEPGPEKDITAVHWAEKLYEESVGTAQSKVALLKDAQNILWRSSASHVKDYDRPLPVKVWNELLMTTLGLPNETYEPEFLEGYTYGLADGEYITRSKAVAGMVKLLHASGFVGWRDATEAEKNAASKAFSDFNLAFDQSKLAIAYSEGLVAGYHDHSFRPGTDLTAGEAFALILKVINKYCQY